MTRTPPAADPTPHLMDEILALLTPLQAIQHRHQELLDAHRTADGDVIEEQRTEYEEVREATAMEASDTLDVVIKRLELLAAVPTRRAFTPHSPAPATRTENSPSCSSSMPPTSTMPTAPSTNCPHSKHGCKTPRP
ncbi:hypothetical protein [Streptomyces sp. H39-C1]|uniref:hypothetical protein n=1 Tax=Streptomyces sp. H39-C1 TaxID=3004355 RepID=UPI0022AF28D3|nr:hypothetical protein [Streptomyces sp. H39-C1]MCZ4102362.1 hypothetical protein [Streptomyces sp. H39-C1]